MNFIRKADDFILKYVQVIADFIFMHTGIGCLWLAKICLAVSACLGFGIDLLFAKSKFALAYDLMPMTTIRLAASFVFFFIMDLMFKIYTKQGYANSMKFDSFLLAIRMFALLMILENYPHDSQSLLSFIEHVANALCYYFLCCNYCPPNRKIVFSRNEIPSAS